MYLNSPIITLYDIWLSSYNANVYCVIAIVEGNPQPVAEATAEFAILEVKAQRRGHHVQPITRMRQASGQSQCSRAGGGGRRDKVLVQGVIDGEGERALAQRHQCHPNPASPAVQQQQQLGRQRHYTDCACIAQNTCHFEAL